MVISLLEQKSIDVKTELDVFKTPEQMITVTYELFKGRQDNGYKVWSSLKAISEVSNTFLILIRIPSEKKNPLDEKLFNVLVFPKIKFKKIEL